MLKQLAPEGRDAAIAEEHGLNGERDGDGEHRRPRTQHDGRHTHPYRMAGGAAGQRQIEHHDDEREGGEQGDERNEPRVEGRFHAPSATYQNGAAAAARAAQVEGLR